MNKDYKDPSMNWLGQEILDKGIKINRMKKFTREIIGCGKCDYLKGSPINDKYCERTGKYVKLNNNDDISLENYIPEWCPLEDVNE